MLNKNKVRIIFLLNTVGEGSGPLQRASRLYENELYNISVLEYLGARKKYTTKDIQNMRIKLQSKYNIPIEGIDASGFYSIKGYIKLFNVIRKEKPYAVFCHHNVMGIAGVFFSWILGVKKIIKVELSDISRKSLLERLILSLVYVISTNVIFISESSRRSLSFFLSPIVSYKSRVIYNGVSFDSIPNTVDTKNIREEIKVGKDNVFIFTASRIHPIKNLEFLLESFAIAKKNNAHIILVVAGRGDASRLIHKAECLGIKDSVFFLGYITRDKVLEIMVAADIFAMSSLSEGFSESVVQAMACKCPCVLTDIPSFREAIRHGEHGALVPLDDPGEYASWINALASKKEFRERLGMSARDYAHLNYSIDDVINNYIELISDD
jgi:glycosyltransferase involved in cell wall biosynthesis